MADIILPTRVKSLTARRRSVDAPSAADVPTAGFRPRLATDEATLAEIAGAETEGILSSARAARLRAELADEQRRPLLKRLRPVGGRQKRS